MPVHMHGMQQRLAVASVLVLVLLASASAVLIAHNSYGQNAQAQAPPQSNHDSSSTTTSAGSTTSVPGGSLLTTGSHNMTGYSDDGNETEHEIETEYNNSTMDS